MRLQQGAPTNVPSSGTGTIAQILAPVAKSVVGVEIVEEAVEAARENASRNGLETCRFIGAPTNVPSTPPTTPAPPSPDP